MTQTYPIPINTNPAPFQFPLNGTAVSAPPADMSKATKGDFGIRTRLDSTAPAHHSRVLDGLHRRSGVWVTLTRVEGEDEPTILRLLAQGTQPLPSRTFIRAEDFSAFRISDSITYEWRT